MDTYEMMQKRSYNVVKQNDIIRKSRYNLTLQQQKILLYFVSRIRPEDAPDTMYAVDLREMCEVCGMRLKDGGYYWTSVKEDLLEIANASVWIESSETREELYRWIDSVTIDKRSSLIFLSFHKTMAPYLFELKNKYSKYELVNVVRLKTKYGIRLYEMLNSMLWAGEMKVTLQDLRKRMDITNVKSYDKFSHFKDRVLDPAVNEISEYTNLDVSYNLTKTGKAYTGILFFIDQKSDFNQIITNHMANKRLRC